MEQIYHHPRYLHMKDLKHLGPKMAPRPLRTAKNHFRWPPPGSQDGAKIHPKSTWKPSKKQSFFLLVLGSDFIRIWPQLGSNLEAKILPKSIQVGPKIDQNLGQDVDHFFAWFLIALGTFFGQFCFEVGRLRGPKTLKNPRFLKVFAISANLPTGGCMIEFLVNLALNLRPKTLQKSTQEASKID